MADLDYAKRLHDGYFIRQILRGTSGHTWNESSQDTWLDLAEAVSRVRHLPMADRPKALWCIVRKPNPHTWSDMPEKHQATWALVCTVDEALREEIGNG